MSSDLYRLKRFLVEQGQPDLYMDLCKELVVRDEYRRRIESITGCERFQMGVDAAGGGPWANKRMDGPWVRYHEVIEMLSGKVPVSILKRGDTYAHAWVDVGNPPRLDLP